MGGEQKLAFLVLPELPDDSEVVITRSHSIDACMHGNGRGMHDYLGMLTNYLMNQSGYGGLAWPPMAGASTDLQVGNH